jgi:hypothetical protein
MRNIQEVADTADLETVFITDRLAGINGAETKDAARELANLYDACRYKLAEPYWDKDYQCWMLEGSEAGDVFANIGSEKLIHDQPSLEAGVLIARLVHDDNQPMVARTLNMMEILRNQVNGDGRLLEVMSPVMKKWTQYADWNEGVDNENGDQKPVMRNLYKLINVVYLNSHRIKDLERLEIVANNLDMIRLGDK